MKSTKIKIQTFSMEDFEQGLMLAGLVTPSTSMELHEREILEEFELSETKKKPVNDNMFFRRVTLAAEIASQMHEEPTFGRIKFQKLVYLCEHAAEMELNYRYLKQAAGPFDNKFMHSVEAQFTKNKWFKVEKKRDGKFNRSVYVPLEKADDYKKFYNAYFKTHLEKIQYVLDLFKTLKTDTTEIAATIYACIIELGEQGEQINEDNLLTKFYAWSEAKGRFDKKDVVKTWSWMKENQVVPQVK
ncbi:MAG TPA: hypothetical protein VGE44_13030 [Daejeonella sp.]|uniref:hypothetical protein n=1 Tax=Daejeonella sp. TaxID=2805397 RepID=UPI002ED9CF02